MDTMKITINRLMCCGCVVIATINCIEREKTFHHWSISKRDTLTLLQRWGPPWTPPDFLNPSTPCQLALLRTHCTDTLLLAGAGICYYPSWGRERK